MSSTRKLSGPGVFLDLLALTTVLNSSISQAVFLTVSPQCDRGVVLGTSVSGCFHCTCAK